METVLTWSLLMAFSAAVTVFTISVCFSCSSLWKHKNRRGRFSGRLTQPWRCCYAETLPSHNNSFSLGSFIWNGINIYYVASPRRAVCSAVFLHFPDYDLIYGKFYGGFHGIWSAGCNMFQSMAWIPEAGPDDSLSCDWSSCGEFLSINMLPVENVQVSQWDRTYKLLLEPSEESEQTRFIYFC